jgi:RNA polymerase sigma factor (sigma-70 family)
MKNEVAWREFLDRFADLIYSTAARAGLGQDDREEAFHASLSAIYLQLPRLRDPAKLIPWIIGISSRQAINIVRLRRRETLVAQPSDGPWPVEPEDTSSSSLPERTLIELEEAQMVREALDALPARCRRLIGYLFLDDPPRSYREAADLERVPAGSIGPTRTRCLERMREYFEKMGWLAEESGGRGPHRAPRRINRASRPTS